MAFEVTVDVLRRLLWARGVPTVATDDELIEASRDAKHKLGITLLSAFAAAGRTLTPAQETELGHHRERIERYRTAWKEVHAVAPGAYRVKGDEIAQYYPEGVLRPSSDLDVVIRDPAQLWAAAHRAIELGWEIGALTVVENRDGGDPDILIEAQIRGDEEIFGIYYGVELRTVDIPTSTRQPAYRVPDPYGSPLAVNTIALLAERWERDFTSRDRLDLALMVDRFTEADQTALVAAPGEIGQDPIARNGVLRTPGSSGASGNVCSERYRFPCQEASTNVEALRHQGCVFTEKQQETLRIERHDRCAEQMLVLA